MGFIDAAPPRGSAQGFTLVEVLVVVLIIGIAAGVASIAWDSSDRDRANREARRFAGALEHAAARAQVRSETLGASADGASWRFWRRDPGTGRWQPLADDDDVLAAHAYTMSLAPASYSGQAIDNRAIVPLRATGRNEPFTFELAARDTKLVLAVDPLNRVTVVEPAP